MMDNRIRKKHIRSIILSAVALLCTVTLLVTITFGWFASRTSSNVLPFGLSVVSAPNLVKTNVSVQDPEQIRRFTFAPGSTINLIVEIENLTDQTKWIVMTLTRSELFGRRYNYDDNDQPYDPYYPYDPINPLNPENPDDEIADFNDVLAFVTEPDESLYIETPAATRTTPFYRVASYDYDRGKHNYIDYPQNLPNRQHYIYGEPALYFYGWVLEMGQVAECVKIGSGETLKINLGIHFLREYTILDTSAPEGQNGRFEIDDMNVFQKRFFRLLQIDVSLADVIEL